MDEYTALAEAREKPRDYFGPIPDLIDQGWAVVWSRHRDSDNIDNSNWDVVLEFLNENYEVNEDFTVEGSSHWAVGWCDQLLVRALKCDCDDPDFYTEYSSDRFRCRNCATVGTTQPVFYDVMKFAESVKDYPLLDEEDYSRREYEDFIEWIEQELHWCCMQVDSERDFDIEASEVASYLFDVHSASSAEDIGDMSWLVDAVREIDRRKQNAHS